MTEKKYVILFLSGLSAMLCLVAAFDRIVDPFWYYRDISIPGFNEIKPKFRRYERHVKPSILEREQPGAVIFGSSYAEIGFDPSRLAAVAGVSAYNFALAGAQWERVYCDVRYALKYDRNLRWIVLGIHPEAMPAADCDLSSMRHPDRIAFLLSADALKASFETVIEQRRGSPSHTAQGLYFYTRGMAGTAQRFREYLPTHSPCGQPSPYPEGGFDLEGLRKLLREAGRRNIGVKLVVYPRHAIPVELEYLCGARRGRWEALSEIVSMAGKAEVWDFEGFNAFSVEKISQAPAVYWQDPAHFNYEYGNIMLDEMFGRALPVVGNRLTPETLRGREDAERAARAAYLTGHPGFDAEVRSLLP